jgi:cation diffusion facilitator CzcD-associated flavoprotein CzcO
MGQFEKVALDYLAREIKDPELRKALTPDSHYGCKRGLVSDDFYPALNRDNVELIAEGLAAVRPDGVTTESGAEIDCDVIVYCTGYRIMDFDRIDVTGLDGIHLADALGDRPAAFKGIATPGFPNYFFAMGPNALVLNAPYFRTAELNVESIVRLLTDMRERGIHAIEVRGDRCDAYCQWMDQRFPRYSWAAPDCQSYYRNAAGYPPFLFPGSFKDYRREHRSLSLDDFQAPKVGTAHTEEAA